MGRSRGVCGGDVSGAHGRSHGRGRGRVVPPPADQSTADGEEQQDAGGDPGDVPLGHSRSQGLASGRGGATRRRRVREQAGEEEGSTKSPRSPTRPPAGHGSENEQSGKWLYARGDGSGYVI